MPPVICLYHQSRISSTFRFASAGFLLHSKYHAGPDFQFEARHLLGRVRT